MGKLNKILKTVRTQGIRGLKRAADFERGREAYLLAERGGNGGDLRIAHVTYYLATNSGDTVLSQCVRRTLLLREPVSGFELIPVRGAVTAQTLEKINAAGLLVIGGGGLFLPDTNANKVSGWQWAVSAEQLAQIDVPVCVFSVGYNYFPGQEPSPLFVSSLTALLEKSAFFGLRNRGSIAAVRALVPRELAQKVCFQPCTTTLIRKLFPELPPHKTTKTVAVNMAFDRAERRYGNRQEEILTQTAAAIRQIQDRGYRIVCVCHMDKDAQFIPYMKAAGVRFEIEDLSRCYPDRVYAFYNDVDVVLGMRGHAQMIPFGLNCGILSLGTHDKMKWFLQDIGAEDWYVDLTEPAGLADRILERFVTVHETERDRTAERLRAAQEELWNITMENLEQIRTLRQTDANR